MSLGEDGMSLFLPRRAPSLALNSLFWTCLNMDFFVRPCGAGLVSGSPCGCPRRAQISCRRCGSLSAHKGVVICLLTAQRLLTGSHLSVLNLIFLPSVSRLPKLLCIFTSLLGASVISLACVTSVQSVQPRSSLSC